MPSKATTPQPSVGRVCPVCAASFMVEANRVRAGRGRFCSMACLRASQRLNTAGTTFTCIICGDPFVRYAAAIERFGAGKYCSRACDSAGRRRAAGSVADRFWAKVKKADGDDACWTWVGASHPAGYGVLMAVSRMDGTRGMALAHRVAWELHYGPIPEGLWVLHRCDRPACVRPEHLFLGTPQDNTNDMWRKGRARFGDRPVLRMSTFEVRAVRHLLGFGADMETLAGLFPLVSRTQLRRVVRQARQAHRTRPHPANDAEPCAGL